jgi:AraC-like DNA-binding protein
MQTTWKTSLIPQHKRTEFWRSAVCDAFLSMTPHIPRAQDFDASLDHLALGSTSLNRITAPAHGVSRTAFDIQRDDKQVFFLNMSPSGRCHVRQSNREHTAAAGQLVLIDSSVPYVIDLPEPGELISLAIPREWLIKHFPQASDRTASAIRSTTISHLLCRQMLELTRMANVDEHQGAQISNVLVSMLSGSLAERSFDIGRSSSRLRVLQKLIANNFSDPDFGPAKAANLAGIALRTLHMEFAQSASSFSVELTKYRLTQARELLTQTEPPPLIYQVAKDCGFKSAEHFSRSFRLRFGRAPSQIDLTCEHDPHLHRVTASDNLN